MIFGSRIPRFILLNDGIDNVRGFLEFPLILFRFQLGDFLGLEACMTRFLREIRSCHLAMVKGIATLLLNRSARSHIAVDIHVFRLDLAGGKFVRRSILKLLFLHIDSTCSVLRLFFFNLWSFLVYFNRCDFLVSFDASTLLVFEFNLVIRISCNFFIYYVGSLVDHFDLFV